MQEVLATEVGDDALFDFTVVAIGFDDADVLVDGAVGRGDFDGADVHRDSITTGKPSVKLKYRLLDDTVRQECHYVCGWRSPSSLQQTAKKPGNS